MFDKLYQQLLILGIDPFLLDLIYLSCLWLVIFIVIYVVQMWLIKKRLFLLLSLSLCIPIAYIVMVILFERDIVKDVLFYSISLSFFVLMISILYRKVFLRIQAKQKA
ncbi:hypothetical protein SAMN05421734_10235 [Pelagirhabdus alkalitolerans]|uniref:Uncharacterized protein n=1 Tax=Pelagirhabdus alkalitolerans TaxID=1612202 RepID=A0A1G6GYB6_9BACI|nr:hypothetical protein [Pelagirhabdus alkalitolerans]SDB87037.1 hypothetical protein SAMN05421734_10235 [Pelagirhabdus alkalitolerans]